MMNQVIGVLRLLQYRQTLILTLMLILKILPSLHPTGLTRSVCILIYVVMQTLTGILRLELRI
jgi:hypothetical protein